MFKFDRRECANKQHRAALKDDKNRFVIATEQIINLGDLNDSIFAIMKNARLPEAYQKKIAKNGKHYFNLTSTGNHQIIAGPSRLYPSRTDMQVAITDMQSGCPQADVISNIGTFSLNFENKYDEEIPEV